jgi:DNA-directed RNA polymerase specialized sigma24 family protein
VETVESDDALLASVRAGTPDWGGIYLAHRQAMYHAAAWVLEGRAHAGVSASDVVQKVVIELQRLGLPADTRDLGALLIRRTIQRAYDEHRRAQRHPTTKLGNGPGWPGGSPVVAAARLASSPMARHGGHACSAWLVAHAASSCAWPTTRSSPTPPTRTPRLECSRLCSW